MKKRCLFLFVVFLTPLLANESYGNTRLVNLENKVEALVQRVDALENQIKELQQKQIRSKTPKVNLSIEKIDYDVIVLSNGMRFFYYSRKYNIEHWLPTQRVQLQKAEEVGYIKLVNLELKEAILVKKL